jgi:hypothetical protein
MAAAPSRRPPDGAALNRILAGGACLLLVFVTLATLNVASNCTAPLHEGDRGSAPVTKLGVAARMGAALRRLGGGGAPLFGGARRGGGGSAAGGRAPTAADVAPHAMALERLTELLAESGGVGDRALGPAASLARALAASAGALLQTGVLETLTRESEERGEIPLRSPVWDAEGLYTSQACYVSADESEQCHYTGALCFDGEGPVVVTAQPVFERVDDLVHTCVDARYEEPAAAESGGCSSTAFIARTLEAGLVARGPAEINADTTEPLTNRRWGPANRGAGLLFRELHAAQVWGDKPSVVRAALAAAGGAPVPAAELSAAMAFAKGSKNRKPVRLAVPEKGGAHAAHAALEGADVATRVLAMPPGGAPHPAVPGLTVLAQTRVGDLSVDWVAPGLWLGALDAGEGSDALAFMRRVAGLFDAQRSNATPAFGDHPKDGFLHFLESWQVAAQPSVHQDTITANRIAYKVGAQWPVPPMTNVAFSGADAAATADAEALGDYYRTTLATAAAPGAGLWFNDLASALGPKKLVCSPSGGIVGAKKSFFTARADAGMWKVYNYQNVGLALEGALPHPHYAPRKVTILKDTNTAEPGAAGHAASSTLWNWKDVVEATKGTGVPYAVVEHVRDLSFDATVRLFAHTGILIAPHGPALANIAYMRAHSVLVELFPFQYRRNAYRQLCNLVDVHYLPVHSHARVPVDKVDRKKPEGLVYTEAFWKDCEARNFSGYDTPLLPTCARAVRAHPLMADVEELRDTLVDAVDCSAAYSLKNPDWARLAPKEGIPVKPPPEKSGEDKYGING